MQNIDSADPSGKRPLKLVGFQSQDLASAPNLGIPLETSVQPVLSLRAWTLIRHGFSGKPGRNPAGLIFKRSIDDRIMAETGIGLTLYLATGSTEA